MRLIRDPAAVAQSLRSGAVAIGNFDGVHCGHARIVEQLVRKAAEVGGPSVVFTFDPHPVRLLRPDEAPPPLTWTDRKAELLAELGVDAVLAYPTDEAFLQLSAAEFFQTLIRDVLDARVIVEGPNFYFGRGREGDIRLLQKFCDESRMVLEIVSPVQVDGQYVSSSRVRALIRSGDVLQASEMLTRPYRIRGMVTHGAGRGGKIGFPTANVSAIDTVLPAPGVYAGRAIASEGHWPAAINLGPNPTFGEDSMKVEVHLIGYAGSLYGLPLEVDFLSRLRDIQRFDGPEALVHQLRLDVRSAAEIAQAARC